MTPPTPQPRDLAPALAALTRWRETSRALLRDGLAEQDPEQARAVLAAHGQLADVFADILSEACELIPRGLTPPHGLTPSHVRKALADAATIARDVMHRTAFAGHPTAWITDLPYPRYSDYILDPEPATLDTRTHTVRGSLPCPEGAEVGPLFHRSRVASPLSKSMGRYGLIWCQGVDKPVGRAMAWTQYRCPGVVMVHGSVLPDNLPPAPHGWAVSPAYRVRDDGLQVLTRVTLTPAAPPAPLQLLATPSEQDPA
ncbi:hypothetical protein ACIP5N_21235 [Streptomyces sp. NPDC088768]|uniref:hypothetical protein n=1 Tax=Streptomyces sp. NPDC088768 TaxID=3365894 RepID=UPI003812660B